MCIILLKKKDQIFAPELVTRMAEMGNRDGFGLMFVEGERTTKGKIKGNTGRIYKVQSMEKPEEIAKIYEQHMDNNIAVHVRNATLGEENKENCHPVTILSKDLGHKIDLEMMHNGTIKDVQVDKKFSDSYNFGTKFLRGYLEEHGYNVLYSPSFQRFLCALIGPNKLLFLDSFEHFLVINRDMWSFHSPSGCLVSTSSDIKVFQSSYIPTHRTGESSTYSSSTKDKDSEVKLPWKHKEGFWKIDADGRSHFMPKKDQSDVGANSTIDEPKVDGIDNGIQLSLDEEAIKEWIEKIKEWDEASIGAFVIENPLEALEVMAYLSEKDKNSSTEEEITSVGLMIAHQPEQATQQLYILIRGLKNGLDPKE
jgi:hypothetical protein